MITRKRAVALMLMVDGIIEKDFSIMKDYLNKDDKDFLRAFKEENLRTTTIGRFMDCTSNSWDLLNSFLKKTTIDDGFKMVFSDSPDFDISVYNDCFVKISIKKLSLYTSSLILGY